MKELQHRVKNTLSMVNSLLWLEEDRINIPEAKESFQETRDRIASISLIYEKLYQSGNMTRVNMRGYLKDLVKSLVETYSPKADPVDQVIEVEELILPVQIAVSIGLITTELVTNSFKHAFIMQPPGGSSAKVPKWTSLEIKKIMIRLVRGESEKVLFAVSDNGKGYPAGFNPEKSAGFGFHLIRMLAEQIGGTISFHEASVPEDPASGRGRDNKKLSEIRIVFTDVWTKAEN